MSEIEKRLADAAQRIGIYPRDPRTPQEIFEILRDQLLPLLQAGQAMRDTAPGTDFDRLASAWDAALKERES